MPPIQKKPIVSGQPNPGPVPVGYRIEQYPYLRIGRDTTNTYNVVELDPAIVNRQIVVQARGWGYYKVNCVAYPIYDVKNKCLIQAESFYPVIGEEVILLFPTISGLLPITNYIYGDDGATGPATRTYFGLFVTLTNDVGVQMISPRQMFSLQGSGSSMEAFLIGFDNVILNARITAAVSTNAIVTPLHAIWNGQAITYDFNANPDYEETVTSPAYLTFVMNKRRGLLATDMRRITGGFQPVVTLPNENFSISAEVIETSFDIIH